MHLNKSRLRFKPQKFSINSTNLTRFLNQNQVTSYSSKLAVATMPSVKKAEKQSNNNTRTDQVRNWYFNSKFDFQFNKISFDCNICTYCVFTFANKRLVKNI